MWALGKNCVAAMKFKISGFYRSRGQAPAHFSDGARPTQFFSGGGGGNFQPQVKFIF